MDKISKSCLSGLFSVGPIGTGYLEVYRSFMLNQLNNLKNIVTLRTLLITNLLEDSYVFCFGLVLRTYSRNARPFFLWKTGNFADSYWFLYSRRILNLY